MAWIVHRDHRAKELIELRRGIRHRDARRRRPHIGSTRHVQDVCVPSSHIGTVTGDHAEQARIGVGRQFGELGQWLGSQGGEVGLDLALGPGPKGSENRIGDVRYIDRDTGGQRGRHRWVPTFSSLNGTRVSTEISRGNPSTRSPMMLRWISSVPPAMEDWNEFNT